MRAPLRSPFISFPTGPLAALVLFGLVLLLTPIDLWRRARHARSIRHGN